MNVEKSRKNVRVLRAVLFLEENVDERLSWITRALIARYRSTGGNVGRGVS